MRLIWRAKARDDYRRIIDYISARNPAGAEKIAGLIAGSIERMLAFPYLYRPGRVPGTREAVVHPNYIVVYQVGDDFIRMLAILHARQKYP